MIKYIFCVFTLIFLSSNIKIVYSKNCKLQVKKGACIKWANRHFYDINKKQCISYIYADCDKNDNNFQSLEACKEECVAVKKLKTVANESPSNSLLWVFQNSKKGSVPAKVPKNATKGSVKVTKKPTKVPVTVPKSPPKTSVKVTKKPTKGSVKVTKNPAKTPVKVTKNPNPITPVKVTKKPTKVPVTVPKNPVPITPVKDPKNPTKTPTKLPKVQLRYQEKLPKAQK